MRLTRRRFLISTALSGTLAYLPNAWASVDATRLPPTVVHPETFLMDDERRFVAAVVERLIPSDELGPGGVEAGLVEFIDRQLAGDFGSANRWYMQGPWQDGTDEQGYQLQWTPAELYRHGIEEVNRLCMEQYRHTFVELSADQQDDVLKAMEDGSFGSDDSLAPDLFDMMLQNTKEGFLADPMYGGNRQFAGWRLIGFPGPRYDYSEVIEQYGQRYDLPPVGILGRDEQAAEEQQR